MMIISQQLLELYDLNHINQKYFMSKILYTFLIMQHSIQALKLNDFIGSIQKGGGMRKNLVSIVSIVFIISCVEVSEEAFSHVMKEGGKTYIVDRTRNRWDVTQAESLGFEPDRFQYGLGKNAFTPLDDRHLADQGEDVPGDLRVIGVAEGNDARAYSVPKLRYHEISNSTLGEKPIAVGY